MLSMLGLLVLGGAFVGLLSGLLDVGGAVIIMPLTSRASRMLQWPVQRDATRRRGADP